MVNTDDKMTLDVTSREKIVKQTDRNFFVEAGAGSGKTTMLVRRMVAMVEAGIDVSKICAITFTKAAAGEFYERFQTLLAERSTAPTEPDYQEEAGKLSNPTDVSRERCLNALQNIDLCFMGTIDSFCNMILSEHPAKAHIPSDALIKSEDEITDIYVREFNRILNGDYGEELKKKSIIFSDLTGNKKYDAFRYGASTIMNVRHTNINMPEASLNTFEEELKDEKDALIQVMRLYSSLDKNEAANLKTKESQDNWSKVQETYNTIKGDWDNPNDIIYAIKYMKELRLNIDWTNSHPDIIERYSEWLIPYELRKKAAGYLVDKEWLEKIITKIEKYKATKTLSFLTEAARSIADECRKNGELTFFDYLLYLRDMLKTDAEGDGKLIKHIYDRHSYFLIDEFQDTNPLQAEVFFYLTAKNPVADWKQCIPRPGSIFIVGDPKQSIYRFRNADVAAFLKVKGMFKDEVGEAIMLTRNFRSTHHLREWFNKTFKDLLPEETSEQSAFEQIPLEEKQGEDKTITGVYLYESRDGKVDFEETDPGKLVGIIKRLVNNPVYKLPGKIDKTTKEKLSDRSISYSDFMIITPSKTSLKKIMDAFVTNGIPFCVEGKTIFSQCSAFVEIVRIFECLSKPKDKMKIWGALKTKTLCADESKLGKIINDGYQLSLFDSEYSFAQDYPKEAEALEKLSDGLRDSFGMSSSALYKYIVDKFRVFEKNGAENLEYVWFALELLRDEEAKGNITSLKEGAEYLNILLNNKSGIERCISLTSESDRVHIANLHKVKGLEAPIVILASPSAKSHDVSIRVEHSDDLPQSWIFKISKPWGEGGNSETYFVSNDFENKIEEENNSALNEAKRLLYVAATRAKNVLIVSSKLKSKNERANNNPWEFLVNRTEGNFFEIFEPNLNETAERETVDITSLYEKMTTENILNSEEIRKKSYLVKRPSNIKTTKARSAEDEIEPSIEEQTEEVGQKKTQGRRDGALIGTMVHKVMEVLVSSKNKVDIDSLSDEVIKEYATVDYTPSADQTNVYKQMLIKVAQTMRNGGYLQTNGTTQDILSEMLSADRVYCEVPFCYEEEAEGKKIIWNGIIDAIYCKNGEWHIIDYKTNAETEGLDEHYESQMTAYEKAFEKMTGEKAKARIYHVEV